MMAAAQKEPLPGSLNANRRLSQWVTIEPAGRVTIHPGKVEIGQGILTALAQIAADELDVALSRIAVRPASTDSSPNEGVTSGSRSVADSGLALRHACAAARHIFLSVTAQRTGVPLEAIRVVDGSFIGPAGQIGTYWDLAQSRLLACEAPARASVKLVGDRKLAGKSAARLDLPDKVFGAPRFIHDIRLPGMKFARAIRPAARNAKLTEVPEAPTGASLVRDGNFLAVVCATEAEANAAADRLSRRVTWQAPAALPDMQQLREFLRKAPAERSTVTEQSVSRAQGARRHTAEFFRPYVAHASVGLCCAVALYGSKTLEVWSHSQSIFSLRNDLARVFGLASDAVIVRHAEGAGCYGHNGADDVALDAALVARANPGVPIRLQWSREDELGWSPFSPAMLVRVEAESDASGNILSWMQDVIGNGHMLRPDNFATPSLLAAAELAQPFAAPLARNPPQAGGGGADRNAIPLYRTPELRVELACVQDMPLRASSLRGLGAMVNVLAIESIMDEIAEAAGRDSIELRLAHLDDVRAKEVIRAVAEMTGPFDKRSGTGRGLGFARYKGTSSYCAVIAEVDAAEKVRVRKLWIAADAGEVINPEGACHQIEGGAVQACSFALLESVQFDRSGVTSNVWERYPILRFTDVPAVDVRLLERPDMPPMGVGECATGPTVAAIANAIYDALGVRPRTMPFTPEQLAQDMAAQT
jgi:CO/xanthine dehydrogenase Mo-binding subunit